MNQRLMNTLANIAVCIGLFFVADGILVKLNVAQFAEFVGAASVVAGLAVVAIIDWNYNVLFDKKRLFWIRIGLITVYPVIALALFVIAMLISGKA